MRVNFMHNVSTHTAKHISCGDHRVICRSPKPDSDRPHLPTKTKGPTTFRKRH